ncbi:SRPBCC family protein [Candidatus Blastococcus massiliensis]|uniref:SRPBCC family protein n=1 Tax=Candidatus Blastococcus massiliensis TaxID=1470358 RepID=UPI0004AE4230|nr:SRPBCC family protein [Candidatus Blastococcus massiliensis]
MQLENSFRVPLPVDEAWRVLLDVERVVPCMPGATLDSVAGDRATGEMKVKLGPINLTYQGTATVTVKDEAAHRAVIDARGKDQRGNGTATALITATLAAEGATTRVDVVTDLTITGRPAQFGKGVMTDVGSKLLGQFADKLAAQLGSSPASAPGPVAKAAATATGAVEEIAASVEQVPGDGAATAAVKKAAAATKKAAAGATEKVTESAAPAEEKPAKKAAAGKKTAAAKKTAPAKTAPAKAAPAKAAPAKAAPAKAAPAKKAAKETPAAPAAKAAPARDSVPAGAKRPSGPPTGSSAPPARPATGAPVRSVPAARPTPPAEPAPAARPEPIDLLEVSGASSPARYAPAVGAAAAVLAVVLLVRRRRRRHG